MQLDKTRIAIRERYLLEILDLALQVIRGHGLALLVTFVVGALPFALLNAWLIGGWAQVEFDSDWTPAYLSTMTLLVVWQMPLAAVPTTLYLGQAMFQDAVDRRQIVRDLVGSLPQLFWYQVVARGLLTPWVISWILPYSVWPFLNEVILLERNPMFKGKQNRMTTARRAKMLHGSSTGDLFGGWILSTGIGLVLILAFWLAMWGISPLLAGAWSSDYLVLAVFLPIAIWIVAGFFAVVRFLAYLDLRIRREGWEVELVMRAEAARIAQEVTA